MVYTHTVCGALILGNFSLFTRNYPTCRLHLTTMTQFRIPCMDRKIILLYNVSFVSSRILFCFPKMLVSSHPWYQGVNAYYYHRWAVFGSRLKKPYEEVHFLLELFITNANFTCKIVINRYVHYDVYSTIKKCQNIIFQSILEPLFKEWYRRLLCLSRLERRLGHFSYTIDKV